MGADRIVAVAGGGGFVGQAGVKELLARGWHVRVLTRDPARAHLPRHERLTTIAGDAGTREPCDELLRGATATVNAVGILRESRQPGRAQTFEHAHVRVPRMLCERAMAMGVRRFVHVSALGVGPVASCEYQRTKWEGEQAVRRSGLDWTILRPSLIHGPGSEFVSLAKGWASGHQAPWFFMPYFARTVEDTRVPLGSVEHVAPRVAPVLVDDVARAIAEALERPAAVGEIFNLVGAQTLAWPELLRAVRDRVPGGNRELEPFGIPSELAALKAKAAAMMGLGALLPFDEGMARMGGQDSVSEREKTREGLGLTPAGFRASFAAYAGSL